MASIPEFPGMKKLLREWIPYMHHGIAIFCRIYLPKMMKIDSQVRSDNKGDALMLFLKT